MNDVKLVPENFQLKKSITYDEYVRNFLVENIGETKTLDEKLKLFFLAFNSVVERKLIERNTSSLSVLEARTKDCRFPKTLIDNYNFKKAVGIEMVKDWYDYSIKRNRPVVFVEDFTNLPFEDNSFDIAFSFKTTGRVKDNLAFLKELCRVSSKFVFILVDDIGMSKSHLFSATNDIFYYRTVIKETNGVVELTNITNPISKNTTEKYFIIYKYEVKEK